MNVRILPAVEERVETGPIQFGDDWPGTFIRGDNAAYYAMILGEAIEHLEKDTIAHLKGGDPALDVFSLLALKGLLSDLQSSRVQPSGGA